MRNSHGVCVKKTTAQASMARPKTKQPKVSVIALLMVGIIGLGGGEQALLAQTETLPISNATPCPLFVPTSVTTNGNTDLPDTAEPAPNNTADELLENQPVSDPFDSLPLTVTELTPTLYLINGEENMAVFVDGNGVLLTGGAVTDRREELLTCVARITALPVKYLIGTHQHDDQTGTINTLLDTGPDTLTIVHENTHARILASGHQDSMDLIFTDHTTLFFDNSKIELHHFGNSHTDGDVVVLFATARVLHAGDLFTDGHPFIDYATGGSSQGWIEALDGMLDLDFSTIIPGRGPIMTRTDLQLFRDWFVTLRTRVRQLVERGVPKRRVAAELVTEDLSRPLEDNSLPCAWIHCAGHTSHHFLRLTLPNLYDELVEARQRKFQAPLPTGLAPEDARRPVTDPLP